MNVQHNCMDNQCGPTGSRPVFQERERTNQTRAQIAHLQNPTDVVLNTAQMRDAVHLQRFRINTPHLDEHTVIHQSAVNEIAASKTLESTQTNRQPRRNSSPAEGAGTSALVRVEPAALTRVRQLE